MKAIVITVACVLALVGWRAQAAESEMDTEARAAAISKALEMWEPVAVAVKGNTVRVTCKENRMDHKIYNAMVGGLCMGTLSRPGFLDGVEEIAFLNRHAAQGFVLDLDPGACAEYLKVPRAEVDIWISARTHVH